MAYATALSAILALALLASKAAAAPPAKQKSAPVASEETTVQVLSRPKFRTTTIRPEHSIDHVLGFRFATGIGEDRAGASAIGPRFSRNHVWESGFVNVGYGLDASAVTVRFESLDAATVEATTHAALYTPRGVLELESRLGAGFDGGVVPIWGIGFSWGFYFLQLGVAAQYPIGRDRPAWLESAVFTLALVIPLDGCASAMIGCKRNVPVPPLDDGRFEQSY